MDQALEALLNDPALCDVPREATLHELKALHARAVGDVLTLRLLRLNQEHIDIVVPICSRVHDLKQEIQRAIVTMEEPALGGRHISWTSLWKTWTLVCDHQELRDPRMLLSDAGVANGSEITFRLQARMRFHRTTRDNNRMSSSKHKRHSYSLNKK